MQSNLTHISFILDRSGSMETLRDDAIGGFNAFLEEQQQEPGMATLTLVQFDTANPYEVVHHFRPIQEVPKLTRETFVPRGGTPLLDALGRGINDLDQRLALVPPHLRPGKVVLAVLTDGEENSSTEFKKAQIASMIQERVANSGWQIVYLSSDINAFHDAGELGVLHYSSARFAKSPEGAKMMFAKFSSSLKKFRTEKSKTVDLRDEPKSPSEPGKP